jgi:hypothetical protein
MSNYLYYNLSGGIDYRSSKTALGLDTKKIYWSDAKNVEVSKTGAIARMNGNRLFSESSAGAEITGMHKYLKGGSASLVLNTAEGKFFFYDSASDAFIEKKTGLNESAKPSYVNYLNGMICSNGVDDPFFFETGVSSEIVQCNATDAADHPIRGTAIAVYKGRVWIGDSGTLYYSALGRYDDWTSEDDAGFIANFHNDSSRIVALKNYKEYLAIYKEDQTYLLSGSSPDNFTIVPFADKGSVSSRGVATIENRQYFFNNGVYTLEQVGELNQIRLSSEVSGRIHSEINSINIQRYSEIIALPYENKRQIWFFMPYNSFEFLNTVWIYDYEHSAWYKRVIPQNITCACVYNNYILSGTSSGMVLIEDSGSTFDGQPVDFSWSSPFFAFSQPNKRKTVDELLLTLDDGHDNNFVFSVCKDYCDTVFDDTEEILTTSAETLLWDVNDWDEASSGGLWTLNAEVVEAVAVSDSNRSVQIVISGNETGQDFALLGFEFSEVVSDE